MIKIRLPVSIKAFEQKNGSNKLKRNWTLFGYVSRKIDRIQGAWYSSIISYLNFLILANLFVCKIRLILLDIERFRAVQFICPIGGNLTAKIKPVKISVQSVCENIIRSRIHANNVRDKITRSFFHHTGPTFASRKQIIWGFRTN